MVAQPDGRRRAIFTASIRQTRRTWLPGLALRLRLAWPSALCAFPVGSRRAVTPLGLSVAARLARLLVLRRGAYALRAVCWVAPGFPVPTGIALAPVMPRALTHRLLRFRRKGLREVMAVMPDGRHILAHRPMRLSCGTIAVALVTMMRSAIAKAITATVAGLGGASRRPASASEAAAPLPAALCDLLARLAHRRSR